MAKKFPPGPCIHCGKHFDELTSDHVFPKAWYPESTPPNLEKWQAPSCRRCNNEHGQLEEDLLYRIGLCVGNEALESLGIGTKVVNAMNPRRAKSVRDEEIRFKKMKSLLAEIREPDGKKPIHCATDNPSGQTISIRLSDLETLGRKIIRGFIHVQLGVVVPDSDEVYCSAKPCAPGDFDLLSKQHGGVFERGPGIQVVWAKNEKIPLYGLFHITVFGRFVLRGGVLPRE